MQRLRKFLRVTAWVIALLFVGEICVGLFGPPRVARRWLSCADETNSVPPQWIVVLGGGGIPSESGLIRCYYAAELHRLYPAARYVVSLPCEGDPATNSVGRMRDELVMRGVPAKFIRMESAALNTHEQAVQVGRLMGSASLTSEVRVVTSSFHLRRALGCFRRAGFTHVSGTAAFNTGAEADPGSGAAFRYTFWANLTAGVEMMRESLAVMVYKVRGWI